MHHTNIRAKPMLTVKTSSFFHSLCLDNSFAVNTMSHSQGIKAPFNSNLERNIGTHIPTINPGPGAYTPIFDSYHHLKPFHKQAKKMHNHSFEWIVGEPRVKGLDIFENNKHVGPDSYEVCSPSKAPKYSWAKETRFGEKPQPKAHLGPGCYYQEERCDGSGALAVFRSRVPKSINNNVSDSQLPKRKALSQLQAAVQQRLASVSSVEVKIKQQKPQKSSFFGSKVPRFQQKNQSPTKDIGPGTYKLEVDDIRLRKSPPKPLQLEKPRSTKEVGLGPGSYDLSNFCISKQLNKKGYPLLKETRFHFSSKKAHSTILPGPGEYMQQKYLYADRDQLLNDRHNQNKRTKSVSHVLPQQKIVKPVKPQSPQFYDVKVFDMSYQLEKKKWYMENLKKLKVQLAPFNSKASRLQ